MKTLNHQGTKAPSFEEISNDLDMLGKQIVDCAFQVHNTMGPGLTENIYEACFICELKDRDINFESQKALSLSYKHHQLDLNYRLDLLIENKVVVELKAVDRLLPVHEAQLINYLKITNNRLGYLINFNVPLIKDGIKRRAL
ncbi:MAG: GxxExxY protein [Alphaproteobacteria bacterium]|nr:GxxExxY protein [Alphaproteobacteria bacterium]